MSGSLSGSECGHFALVRAALLSVDDAARMVAGRSCDDPVVASAVALAAGDRVLGSGSDRARTTLVRYLARMGGRATPFGLFAGTATADVAGERRLELGPRDEHRVRVRIDVEALRLLVQEAFDEQPLDRRPLRPNPTLRDDGAALSFARSGDASADVVTMRPTRVIRELLAALDGGTATGAELVDGLAAAHPGATGEALRSFVEQLVGSGVLLPALDLVAPGAEPADLACALLDRMGDARRAAVLRALLADGCGLAPLDPALPDRLGAAWAPAAEHVTAWRDIAGPHRFHVELRLGMPAATLDRGTVDDLEQAVLRLVAMSSGRHELDDVRDAFRARYEDAEVPLLQALDLEGGVHRHRLRGTSVLAGSAGVRFEDPDDMPRVDPRRLEILDRWLCDGDPVDIAHLPAAEHSPVRSVQAALLDDHEGRYRSMLVGGAGRAPFALIARFGLGCPDLERRMAQWCGADAGGPDDPIRAELVYNPGGRIANVLIRPKVFPAAIALAGAAGGTLALDRLLLRVHGDRFALRDTVTGRPVHVELSSAHNVDMHGQDPLYSFLGHLASPGGAAWSWGALERLSHLPRVTCGSVVVAPERWRLPHGAVREVLDATDPAERLRGLLPGIAERRWVGTGVHDHILPIDLSAAASVAAALGRSAATGSGAADHVDVVEMPQLESPAVAGPTGRHVAEVVVPVAARRPVPSTAAPARFDTGHGDRWVYFRFHAGFAAADAVVARVAEVVRRLRADGLATGWFFVRYSEDGHHVRVRVRPADGDGNRDTVVSTLAGIGRELRAKGLLSRVVMDDYVPEVARYGGAEGLALAEELFDADSDQVARLVEAGTDEQHRLYQAVADMVAWCGVLFDGRDAEREAGEFLRIGSAGQGLSFLQAGNRHGRFFREHRVTLEEYLDRTTPDDLVLDRLAALAASVRGRLDARRSASVLGSALHLHCNRLFAFDANRLEFLGYELTRRTLRARAARRGGVVTTLAVAAPDTARPVRADGSLAAVTSAAEEAS